MFFLDFEKKRKKVPVGLINLQFHRPLTRSNFTITFNFGVGNLAVLTSGNRITQLPKVNSIN